MATIFEVRDNFKKLDVLVEATSVIVDEKEEILDLNKKQLLDKGENKKRKKLRTYKNTSYARLKNKQNPNPGFGNPDLYRTGNFFETWVLKILSKEQYDIRGIGRIARMLQEKYGEDIYGMSEESAEKFIEDTFRKEWGDRVLRTVKLK